ncbi:hypothetical protein [Virgibacillus ainsalahensis]
MARKYFFALWISVVLLLTACGNENSNTEEADIETEEVDESSDKSDASENKEIIREEENTNETVEIDTGKATTAG